MYLVVVVASLLSLAIYTPLLFVGAKLLPTFSNDPHSKLGPKQTWITSAYIAVIPTIISLIVGLFLPGIIQSTINFVAYLACIMRFWKASALGAFLFALGLSVIAMFVMGGLMAAAVVIVAPFV